MIQLIRFMRDAEDFNTGGGMEQTPIEKAIDLINANKNQAEHLTSFEVHNAFYNMLQSLLPYEKKIVPLYHKRWLVYKNAKKSLTLLIT